MTALQVRSKGNQKAAHKRELVVIQDIPSGFGKLPPQAIDLEQAVVGALLLERDALTTVISFLKAEHFYDSRHSAIYSAVVTLFQNTSPVDMRTVVHQLRVNGTLEFSGGAYYVAELTSKVSSAANIEYHARIIVEMTMKRNLITLSSQLTQDAYEDSVDVFELLDKVEQRVFEICQANTREETKAMATLMNTAVGSILSKMKNKSASSGVPSGILSLDRVTDGWQASDLIIIAARPGMGKSGLAATIIRNAAVDFNLPVALFSLEMSSQQVVNRLISMESELDGDIIKKGNLADYQWQQLVSKTSRLSNAPIFIDDTPALSILELRAKSRRLKAQDGVQLIIVDYLQLMKGDMNGNREQEIASISRALKTIAKELSVPVIALSQLSRGVETRGGDKRPQLSDLRESGSIEQDADMVIFLYRPEYYKIDVDEQGLPTAGTAELIIAKHRNGSLENVKTKFIGKFTKFVDLEKDYNKSDSFDRF
jgi:replicative DNA helicase